MGKRERISFLLQQLQMCLESEINKKIQRSSVTNVFRNWNIFLSLLPCDISLIMNKWRKKFIKRNSIFYFRFLNNWEVNSLTWIRCSSSTLNVSCISFIFNSTLRVVDWIAWIVPMTTLKSESFLMFRSRFCRCCWVTKKLIFYQKYSINDETLP